MIQYYSYLWGCRYAKPDEKLFDQLPQALRSQVEVSLKRQLVERVNLFHGLSAGCLVELVSRLVPLIALPDDYIILQGEVGREMLFIKMY